eukprot:3447116-Rhodomonas_salina.2
MPLRAAARATARTASAARGSRSSAAVGPGSASVECTLRPPLAVRAHCRAGGGRRGGARPAARCCPRRRSITTPILCARSRTVGWGSRGAGEEALAIGTTHGSSLPSASALAGSSSACAATAKRSARSR